MRKGLDMIKDNHNQQPLSTHMKNGET